MKHSYWCNSTTRDGHLISRHKQPHIDVMKGNIQFWLCALDSNRLQSAVQPDRWAPLTCYFCSAYFITRLNCGVADCFSVMATTCRSKLINRPRTFPGLSADQQKFFFFFFIRAAAAAVPSYICWNTFEMGSELEESHQKVSSQSCRRQSRSPLLLFKLGECLSRLTFCSA